MSNKNLLNESTIRKFMKLASIEPLASDFISKIQESEEELEEGYGHEDDKKASTSPKKNSKRVTARSPMMKTRWKKGKKKKWTKPIAEIEMTRWKKNLTSMKWVAA